MEKPGLLSLPDEVLLHIFSYLDGIDKINTHHTCVRFRNVLCERRLSRKLKLIGNYSVTMQDIKHYLKPKMMQQNIRVLDLTNCYWLEPAEVCATVLHLKNLVAFYSVGVAFTFNQLIQIFIGCPKIKYVSLSWPAVTTMEDVKEDCLDSIVFLYIHFPKVAVLDWFQPYSWICKCRNLKHLWLITTPGNDTWDARALQEALRPESILDTLVILGQDNWPNFEQLRLMLRISSKKFKCLWLPTDLDIWQGQSSHTVNCLDIDTSWWGCFYSLGCKNQRVTFEKNGKAKRLFWSNFKSPFSTECALFEDLEELETENCFPLIWLQPLHLLTVLCIPACSFSGPEGKHKQQVQMLPKWCPEIHHLELGLCKRCQNRRQENNIFLEVIAGWPELRTLKLSDCYLSSGKGLETIFKCCKNLEKLFVKNLGPSCGYMFKFTKALRHCKNLRDFRFEEKNVPIMKIIWLFEALAECPLIERVVFVFPNSHTSITDKLVLNLIEKSPKLIFLGVIAPFMAAAQSKRLMKTVTKQFIPARPALRCCFVMHLDDSEINKLPAIHYFELISPDISGPFQLPHKRNFFFEVPDLDVATIEAM